MKSKNIFDKTILNLEPHMTITSHANQIFKQYNHNGIFSSNLKELCKTPQSTRPYIPGDPTKLIDWRSYARTGELTVRLEPRPSLSRVAILLDANSSMFWPNQEFEDQTGLDSCSKIFFSSLCSLHLAFQNNLLDNQVSLFYSKEEKIFKLNLINNLEIISLSHKIKKEKSVDSFLSLFKEDSISSSLFDQSYIFSDLFKELTSTPRAKKKIIFHTLSSYEKDYNWLKKSLIYFPKNKKTKKSLGENLLKETYLAKQFNKWTQKKQKTRKEKHEHYHLLSENTRLGDYLKSLST